MRATLAQRAQLAEAFLAGRGIEIGALSRPLRVPAGCRVRYVDHLSTEAMRAQFPKHAATMVEVDVVDDGETLRTLPDASEDFVVANHMLEHCQDPVATLRNHLRVLRPGGVLFLALPDKTHTFDRDRPVTTVEHMVRDFVDGPGRSKQEHYEEWSRLVTKVPEERVKARARQLIELDYHIHFHVFTLDSLRALLEHVAAHLFFPMRVVCVEPNANEILAVIRKT